MKNEQRSKQKVTFKDIIDFFRSADKITKRFFIFGTPIIISLFSGGIFLKALMLINGTSCELELLSNDLLKCGADCLSSIYIPALIIEFVLKAK